MEPIFADVINRLEAMHSMYFEHMDGLSSEDLDWSPGAGDEFALRIGGARYCCGALLGRRCD